MMKFIVKEDEARQRADVFLTAKLSELNRSSIKRLFESSKVTINGENVKAGYQLKVKDKIFVDFDPESLKKIEKINLEIIYEDDDCIVINKPEGLLTHSKGAFNPEPTVATFISSKLRGLNGDRGGIVHRLDRATSGVIVCAKTPEAMSALQKQFSSRKAYKKYIAIVSGKPDNEEAIIDMPIARNYKNPKTFTAAPSGKKAQTHYKIIKTSETLSELELMPKTGRTHQLRVHLSQIGHPILGDTLYGGEPAERVFLHALSLEITLPSGERKTFVSTLPKVFGSIIS